MKNNDKVFLNSTLKEWRDISFAFTSLDNLTQNQIKELEKTIAKVGGYIIGNLDYAISLPFEIANSITDDDYEMEQPEIKAVITYRKKIGK
jgi:hypothetical protein